MAAKQTLIKKIIRDDILNVKVLLLTTVFGNKIPELYDPNKVYNKGDIVVYINEDGTYSIYVVQKDNVTGRFEDILEFLKELLMEGLLNNSILSQATATIKSIQEGMADDIGTLVYNLAGLLDNDMNFNQIFRENFKNNDNLNIVNGKHEIGSMVPVNNKLEFMLFEAKGLECQPKKFKLKHHMEISGTVGVECELTFNGLDDEPFWFDVNEAILDGSFFDIPEFKKQDEIPYALNFRIKCNCNPGSNITISDFMVVFI